MIAEILRTDYFTCEIFYVKRKTLEIAVYPDKRIVIKAPLNSDKIKILEKIKKRSRWIKKQIRYFQGFSQKNTNKEFFSGETHLFLGKPYRLRIVLSTFNDIKIERNMITVLSENPNSIENIQNSLESWYRG